MGLEETEVEDELSWVPEYGQSAFSLLLSESSKMMVEHCLASFVQYH